VGLQRFPITPEFHHSPCTRPIWKKIRAISLEHEFNSEERGIMRVIVRRRRSYSGRWWMFSFHYTSEMVAEYEDNTGILQGSWMIKTCRGILRVLKNSFSCAIIRIFDLSAIQKTHRLSSSPFFFRIDSHRHRSSSASTLIVTILLPLRLSSSPFFFRKLQR
jgi:hypothetical protein